MPLCPAPEIKVANGSGARACLREALFLSPVFTIRCRYRHRYRYRNFVFIVPANFFEFRFRYRSRRGPHVFIAFVFHVEYSVKPSPEAAVLDINHPPSTTRKSPALTFERQLVNRINLEWLTKRIGTRSINWRRSKRPCCPCCGKAGSLCPVKTSAAGLAFPG